MPRISIPDDSPPVLATSAVFPALKERAELDYHNTLPASEDVLIERIGAAEVALNIRASSRFTERLCRLSPPAPAFGAADQRGAIPRGAEARTIAETAVAGHHQNLLLASGQIQLLAQLAHHPHEALREVVLFDGLLVFFPGFRFGFA